MAIQIQPDREVESSVLQTTKSGQGFLPYCMELGSSYRVRRAPTRPLSLLTAAADLEMELVRGGFPKHPQVLKFARKPLELTETYLEVIVYYRERVQTKTCRRDAQTMEGSNTKPLLSSGRLTILALMCIGYCQSQKLTDVLVCRFFVVAAVYPWWF